MKNFVIESLTPEHGKEIIKYIRSLGVDTELYIGDGNKKNGDNYRFYGVINDAFVLLNSFVVKALDIPIITLPTTPKRGDWVYVSDKPIDPKCTHGLKKSIFLTKIDGAIDPFIVVSSEHNNNFLWGQPFDWSYYRYALPIPKEKLFTVKDLAENSGISEKEVEEIVLEHLKNK